MSQTATASNRHAAPPQESTHCPECSGSVQRDGQETVCQRCGLVVDTDHLDRGPEWRIFDPAEIAEKRRVGAPRTISRHDRGLSTELGNQSDLRRLPTVKRRRIQRLRMRHKRAVLGSKRDRNLVYALQEIRRIASDVDLPTGVRDRACKYLQDAQDANLLKGRDIDGFNAASVYAASRLSGTTRSIQEVAAAARVDPSTVQMCFATLNRSLELALAPPQAREYLPRYASRLDLPHHVEADARRLLEQVDDQLTVGKNPCGVAGAALYVAARETPHRVSQADTADAAGVTPVTLRSTTTVLEDVGSGGGD